MASLSLNNSGGYAYAQTAPAYPRVDGMGFGSGYTYAPTDGNFFQDYWRSVSRWASRVIPAKVGQDVADTLAEKLLAGQPSTTSTRALPLQQAAVALPINQLVNGALGPEHFLGWNTTAPTPTEARQALQSPRHYARYVGRKLNAPKVTLAQAGGLRRSVSQLVINDFKGLVNAINLKKWILAGSTALGLGLQGLSIAKETKAGYDRAKRNGSSDLAALNSGIISFGKAFIKSGISWHAGNVGFRLGAILGGPLGALAGTLAGIAIGGLTSVATKTLMDNADKAVYGDPKDDAVYA
jgi:hypothetical protein